MSNSLRHLGMTAWVCAGIIGTSLGFSLGSSGTVHADSREFDQAVAEVNGELVAAEARGHCPGLSLALSCGNGACELGKGENETTCPADCDFALIRSYNSLTLCHEVSRVMKPSTIAEVQEAILATAEAGERLRIVGRQHSINSQLCTAGTVITTENLTRIVGLEDFHGKETVLVEAGATLYDVAEWLHDRGKSLGFAVSGYRGVSIAGAAATGVHGSSARHSAVVSAALESVWVVGADGELREYWAGNTDASTWKALRAGLGMLGAVVRVRLRVEPQFNLRTRLSYWSDKRLFESGGAVGMVKDCDFGSLLWFPGAHKVMRTCGTRSQAKADPGANNVFLDPNIPSLAIKPFKAVLQLGACHNWVGCLVERVQYLFFKVAPVLEKRNRDGRLVHSTDVTGPSHRMQSSALSAEQRRFVIKDWEIAIPASRIQEALVTVRDIFHKYRLCSSIAGVALRFTPAEDATLLAHSTALGEFRPGEPVLFLEIPAYSPAGFSPEQMERYEHPYQEMVQTLIERFGGRGHWAKNADWVFGLQRELDVYGSNMAEFRRVARTLDPGGLFMNSWGKYVGLAEPDPLERALAAGTAGAACRVRKSWLSGL